MKRKIYALLFVLAALLSMIAPFKALAQGRRPRRAPRPGTLTRSGPAAARFNQITDAYLRGYYAFNPTEATALGLHEYDRTLESRSRESVGREISRLRAVLAELSSINGYGLKPVARDDYLLLVSQARSQLLELQDIRMWRRDPSIYTRTASASIDNILKRNYAPPEQRLDAVLARERQIVRLLGEARANLESPPRIYTEMAIPQARRSIDYFTRDVPQMIEQASGGRLSAARKAEVEAVNNSVIEAVRSFAGWLESDLLPRSTGDFRLGADTYRRKLLYDEMVDTPAAQLIRSGEKELQRTQDEMRALAEEIAPGKGLAYALRIVRREHPAADGLVGDTRAEVDRTRAFLRSQEIITPPERESLTVAESPLYAPPLRLASLNPPGPFERVETEAYFYVTPPDPSWDAARSEEYLRDFNRYDLLMLSVHEACPGRYYQFLALKRSSPSRVRATFSSASFIAGWAHYCEQMMLEEGFGGNNPKLKLAQLHRALRLLCRYLVSLRMHTEGMTYEEGVEFLMREGYEERVNAERGARRETVEPIQLLSYTLGKNQILQLREEYRRRMGPAFRLAEFHDRLLSYGMPPVKIVRLALLGNAGAGPAAAASNDVQPQASAIDFSVLATGTMSGYEGARALELITDQNDFQRAWGIIGNNRPAPEISFNTNAVIIAYQGLKRTGGYSISIAGIRREGKTLAVRVNEQSPKAGEMTPQVITSPFVAVSVPRPPAGTSIKFDDNVRNTKQTRPVNKGTHRRRRGYRLT